MRRVLPVAVPQRPQDDYISALDQFNRGRRQRLAIRQVGYLRPGCLNNITVDFIGAVIHDHRDDGNFVKHELAILLLIDRPQLETRPCDTVRPLSQRIGIGLFELFNHVRRQEHRDHALLHTIVNPRIVEAKEMIGVVMREKNRINPVDVGTQALVAEVRRRVDDDADGFAAHPQTGSQTFVAGIVGTADLAITTDLRYAERRASTKKLQAQSYTPSQSHTMEPHEVNEQLICFLDGPSSMATIE